MRKGQFTLDDFLGQMRQMKKLGPLESLSACCPAERGHETNRLQQERKEFRRMEGMICSP
jgi:signal recognition particle subunit SRP54